MPVSELIRTARGIEAVENFARADGPLELGAAAATDAQGADGGHAEGIHSDDFFWATVAGWFPRRDGDPGPEDPFAEWWEKPFQFMVAGVSEWVARVPGLHASPGAAALRASARSGFEAVSNGWRAYSPQAKTALVLGGTGTLKLPPNDQGYHLVSLSVGHNASTGIPALVAPEVWEHALFQRRGSGPKQMAEGDVLYGVTARWRKMSLGWAERFESVKGIPRGYLALDKPECIQGVEERDTPMQFHPCTVMEYESGDALLWDFVFCSVDTQVEGVRKRVEEFFAGYRRAAGRDGHYLFPADVADPWWEAEFASPAELRAARQGRTQLELMRERVYQRTYRGQTLDTLIHALAERCTVDDMREFAAVLDLRVSNLGGRVTPGEAAAELVHAAAQRKDEGAVEALLDALLARVPRALDD